MTERSTCWSVTINNPTEEDYNACKAENLPSGWRVEGQEERGEEGTKHLQLMLRTPQIRFAGVKKHFIRAHIEVARNPIALQKYVNKDNTRDGEKIKAESKIPTIYEYQRIIVAKWNSDEFKQLMEEYIQAFPGRLPNEDELAMRYLDSLVATDIESGRPGAEFIATNPMWINSWKKFWRSIIKRHASHPPSTPDGTEASSLPPSGSRPPDAETHAGDAGPLFQREVSIS